MSEGQMRNNLGDSVAALPPMQVSVGESDGKFSKLWDPGLLGFRHMHLLG